MLRRRRAVAGVVLGGAFVLIVAAGIVGTESVLPPLHVDGRTSAPPWSAPTDPIVRVHDAGLRMLGHEGTALHIHSHLSVTVDGDPVVVPAHIGIDVPTKQYSPLHTHGAAGIVHIESPIVTTFFLGQVFSEWNVRLAPGRVGSYVDGAGSTRVVVFVDGRRWWGDPTRIRLADLEDIDVVITTTRGAPVAVAPPAFAWPAGYR